MSSAITFRLAMKLRCAVAQRRSVHGKGHMRASFGQGTSESANKSIRLSQSAPAVSPSKVLSPQHVTAVLVVGDYCLTLPSYPYPSPGQLSRGASGGRARHCQ